MLLRGTACLTKAAILIVLLWVWLYPRGSAGQDTSIAWFNVGQEKSGIIFVARGDVSGLIFTLKSDGIVLDSEEWLLDLPFIKQYRVDPGEYNVSIPSIKDDPIVVTARANELSVIKLDIKNVDKIQVYVVKQDLVWRAHICEISISPRPKYLAPENGSPYLVAKM